MTTTNDLSNEIYVKADCMIILRILDLIRDEIGGRVRIVDLNPELKQTK